MGSRRPKKRRSFRRVDDFFEGMKSKAKTVIGPGFRKFRPEKVREKNPFVGFFRLHGEKGKKCQGFFEESDGLSVSKDSRRTEEPQFKHLKLLLLFLRILSSRNISLG